VASSGAVVAFVVAFVAIRQTSLAIAVRPPPAVRRSATVDDRRFSDLESV
jgi:hypothetical protein